MISIKFKESFGILNINVLKGGVKMKTNLIFVGVLMILSLMVVGAERYSLVDEWGNFAGSIELSNVMTGAYATNMSINITRPIANISINVLRNMTNITLANTTAIRYVGEKVTCIFRNSTRVENCTGIVINPPIRGQIATTFKCSGRNNCNSTVTSMQNKNIRWRSTCSSESKVTRQDGRSESVTFNCRRR